MGHRAALITAGSIALVIFAGAVAVGANLGILNAADSRPFGKLSAASAAPATDSEVIRVYAGEKSPDKPQMYVIKKAGTVSVSATKNALWLTGVTVRPGWKWALAQTSDSRLKVTFTSSAATYKFVAVLDRDGTLLARVDRPVTKVVASAPSGSGPSYTAPPATSTAAPAAAPAAESDDHHDEDEQDEQDD